jgi:hypothetical protein
MALDYVVDAYKAPLARAGLRAFEDFWKLEWNWVEPRNERRNGWSGATRARIQVGDEVLSLFVKRQENHCYRSLRHPFRGRPTFFREWNNIHRLRAAGVPTLDPVYYGERIQDGRYQATLVSLALDEFRELDRWFADRDALSDAQRRALLQTAADVLRRFHRNGLQHNCLGGNHLMLRTDARGGTEARLLDLEKLKVTHDAQHAAARDLARFIRHTPTLLPQDHQMLISAYADDLAPAARASLVEHLNRALQDKHLQHGRPAHSPIVLDEKL